VDFLDCRTVRATVNIAYRGARYEIGRAKDFYGIWTIGAPSEPLGHWPATPQGWYAAWSYFIATESPETIAPVAQPDAPVLDVARRTNIAAGLLALGVALGLGGLFPSYLGGASLAGQPAELVPHAIELAIWSLSAILIVSGVARRPVGALLALGTSVVTFGLFFADAGTAIAGGAHLVGAGLVLGLLGWLACASGSVFALQLDATGTPKRPHVPDAAFVAAAMIAALGAAIAFAPSWDSFTLRTAAGASHSLTAGNAFANPGPVIFGNVAVMVAIVAVVAVAVLWRPVRLGAALLIGAVVPLVAQAISALVQLGQGVSPTQFGISTTQAAQAGLKISSGVTPVFWIYCAFVIALVLLCARMLITRRPVAASPAQIAWVPG
jgi:hypothetical protein